MSELREPLVQAYGLNVLLNLVQLKMANQAADEQGITITDADVEAEQARTLEKMFAQAEPEDYDALLDQFLAQQNLSAEEFRLVMRINATLRALSSQMVAGKLSDASLEEAFRQLYGEKVRVRHIQLANLQEVADARQRLAAGESFEQVARRSSRNERTRGLGGELPPFSRATQTLPQIFKDIAFSLKVGEVSDPVGIEDSFHLIKLEEEIAPTAVKFEDVKESIREDLEEAAIEAAIRELRTSFAQQALATLDIENPVLRRQFEERRDQRQSEVRGREAVIEQLDQERQMRAQQETDAPTTVPAPPAPAAPAPAPPATNPAAAPQEGLRPPATTSAAPANAGAVDQSAVE